MTLTRWHELMAEESATNLTRSELDEGWHWCNEFDGLLVKGDPKAEYCGQSCLDGEANTELEP